jgi:hypothetical protein
MKFWWKPPSELGKTFSGMTHEFFGYGGYMVVMTDPKMIQKLDILIPTTMVNLWLIYG